MADTAKPSHPRDASDVKHWHREADVVIVGAGGAGVCAALEARAAGADVLVLERAWKGGGPPRGVRAALHGRGTPLQKACGFEDDPEEMYKYLIASCGPGADAEKIRLYCERSVEHYHWITGRGVRSSRPICRSRSAPIRTPTTVSPTPAASSPIRSARSRSPRRAATPRSRWARTRAA